MPVLDHLVLGTPDLETTVADLGERLGIAPAPGGSHPGMGTRNAVFGLGDDAYFEIIGPDPAQDVAPQWFGIAALTEPRLVGWAIRTTNIDLAVASARERGYDPGEPVAMSRHGTSGPLSWRLTLPSAQLLPPFLIDWGTTAHPTTRNLPEVALELMMGEHPDPAEARVPLNALGIDLALRDAPQARLLATLVGPAGRIRLS